MIIETDIKIYKLHIRLTYQYKTSTLTSLKIIKEVQRLLNIFMQKQSYFNGRLFWTFTLQSVGSKVRRKLWSSSSEEKSASEPALELALELLWWEDKPCWRRWIFASYHRPTGSNRREIGAAYGKQKILRWPLYSNSVPLPC